MDDRLCNDGWSDVVRKGEPFLELIVELICPQESVHVLQCYQRSHVLIITAAALQHHITNTAGDTHMHEDERRHLP